MTRPRGHVRLEELLDLPSCRSSVTAVYWKTGGDTVPKATVMLDPELHRELRHLAVDLGTSFQQMAVQALREFMERRKADEKRQARKR